MATRLTPVDGDPFAQAPQRQRKLTPVAGDPFAKNRSWGDTLRDVLVGSPVAPATFAQLQPQADRLRAQGAAATREDLAHSDGLLDRAGDFLTRGAQQTASGLSSFFGALGDLQRRLPHNPLMTDEAAARGDELLRTQVASTRATATARRITATTPIPHEMTWKGVKDKPSAANIGQFILEQGTQSLPGMGTAIVSLPVYAMSNAGQIAQQRALNDGREDASVGDVVKSAPAAVVSAALERIGLNKIVAPGAGNLIVRMGKAALAEGLTEAGQSGVEYAGGSAGTDHGFKLTDMFDQMLQGAAVGAPIGAFAHPVAEAPHSLIEAMQGRQAVREAATLQPEAPQLAAPLDPVPEPVAPPRRVEPKTPAMKLTPVDGDPFQSAATEPPAPAPAAVEPQPVIGAAAAEGGEPGTGGEAAAAPPTMPQTAQASEPQPLQEGEKYVRTPAGNKIRTRTEVVDASTLAKAEGAFQNRDRSRDTTELQVQDIIGKFDPELLGDDPSSDRGGPVVGADHTVYSGNGRMLALNKIFEQYPEKADAYRRFIESQGHSTEGIERPVLIRRIAQDMSPDELRQFVVESNKDNKLEMSPVERARSDADAVTPEMLDRYAGGDLNSTPNQGFVAAFTKQLTAGEMGNVIGSDRRLTTAGIERVENAVVAKAYDHPRLLEKLMESAHNEIRAITSSLANVAPAWAKMRAAAKGGEIQGRYDITSDLADAAMRVAEARRRGTKPADLLTQTDAFDPMTPTTEALIRAFYNSAMTRPASVKAVTDFLGDYIGEANSAKQTEGLFGAEPGKAPLDIIKDQLAKRDRPDGEGLFDAVETKPRRLYRGEHGAGHADELHGRLGSISFTGDRKVAETYARHPNDRVKDGVAAEPRVVEADVNIKNPVINDDEDPFIELGAIEKALGRNEAIAAAREFSEFIENTSNWQEKINRNGEFDSVGDFLGKHPDRVGELYFDAYPLFDDPKWVAKFKAAGFDGAIHGGNGESALTTEYKVFDKAQAKRVNSTALHDAPTPADESTGAYQRSHARGATTDRPSDLRSAVEHLGLTWDDFNLKAPPTQMQLLQRAINEKLGIRVTVDHGELGPSKRSIPYRVAIDQMLDAFHNITGMAAVLGLPEKAMSLNGTLTLHLIKNSRAFYGAYYPGEGKIALPGRSNAFAHEWGHAFDYHMMGILARLRGNGGLSGLIRKAGKGIAQPGVVAERFTDLLQTMFFDQAALATKIMELEARIAATKSKSAKATFERQIERIKEGAGQHRAGRTDYYKKAKAFDQALGEPGGGYWQKPTEMLARAFEAYVAKKAADAGMSTEVISHADADYLSNADERLANTFPKEDERSAIFEAFDGLFDAVAGRKELGDGERASIPENPARREDATSERVSAFRNIVRNELGAFADARRAREKAAGQPKDRKGLAQKANDVRHFLFSGMAAELRALGRRWDSKAIAELHDLLVSEAGTGKRLQRRDFIMARRLRANRYANSIGRALADFGPRKVEGGATAATILSKDQAADVRAMLTVEDHQPVFPELKTLASRLREISDGIWHDLRNAGFSIGYARNGFLPRIYDVPTAEANMDGFLKQARKVYEATGLEEDEARQASAAWYHRLVTTSPHSFDQHTPHGDFLKGRELPPEADTLMADYMVNEPMDLMRRYAEAAAHRIEWARRFGIDNARLNGLYEEMARERVDSRDIATISTMLDIMAGQNPMRVKNPTLNALGAGFNTIYGTVALLGRATFQSLAESITAGVVLENPVYGISALTDLVAGTLGTAKAKERRELASFIGLVDMTNHTHLLADRFGGSYDDPVKFQKINNKLFYNTGLIALTRAQYTHNMGVVNAYLVHLSHTLLKESAGRAAAGGNGEGGESAAEREVLARFKELGIRDPLPFAQWMSGHGGPSVFHKTRLPTKDELAEGLDEKGTAPWAFDWITATRRLSERIIQDPHAMTKPMLSHSGNIGRLVTGIQAFNYSAYENVLKPVVKRFAERAQDGRWGGASKAAAATIAAFGALYLGQLVATVVRVFLTDRDRWREEEKNGTLHKYLAQRTASNFVGDPLDPAVQAVAGLKYNRPLGASVEGPAAGNFLANATDVFGIAARNSRKTNTAEHNSLNGAYRLMSPWASAGAGSIPGGPLLSAVEGATQSYITSPQAGQTFATAIVGPKNGRIGADGKKIKSGPTAYDLFLDRHLGEVKRKPRAP